MQDDHPTFKQTDGKFSWNGAKITWSAHWIWDESGPSPRNYVLAAWRDFEIDPAETSREHRLHLTADTRYRLWLNGRWLGDGPARSFPHQQQFDTHDLSGLLLPGANRIAVLVHHFGEGTFQADPSGLAGLLVQLERRGKTGWTVEAATDASWQVCRHTGYQRPTLRISCQMPFEEIFDARAFPADWTLPGVQVPEAQPARIVATPGKPGEEGPWKQLVARSVPFFTRTPVLPSRLWRAAIVHPANFSVGFNFRPYLLPGNSKQNHAHLPGFAATIIDSPTEQLLELHVLSERFEPPILNGQRIESGQPIPLKAGENLCLIPFKPGIHHEYERSYAGFVDQPVELRAPFSDSAAWTVFGPVENWEDGVYNQVCTIESIEALDPYRSLAQPVCAEDTITLGSPWNETTVSKVIETAGAPAIDNPDALFNDDSSAATVHPSPMGDVELFFDFGRQLVGYIEMEIEAPAGTICDWNLLEEIEDDERIHYTYGNQNAFSYVARGGRQRYTSFLRRGVRYAKLTLRAMRGPVKIYRIATLFSTHPPNERGAFHCSDPLLSRIWEVGRHTLRCCSEDTFTDCPTYEQTYWVGDGRGEALINYAVFGDLALTRRCAQLPAESLFRAPIPESQVPSAWENLLPAWSLLWIMMVEEHWQFSGDRDYLAAIYPPVRTTLRNIREQFTDDRGLFAIQAWNLFDWAPQDIEHEIVTHNQILLVEAWRRAAVLAEALGGANDAQWCLSEAGKLSAAINEHLWDDAKGAYVDALHEDGTRSAVVSQQVNTLALLYGVAPPERTPKIADYLHDPPEGVVRIGSPFAMFFSLDALNTLGQHDRALAMIRDNWGMMLDRGATSFWETFPGFNAQWWSRSYCHAWSAGPTHFLSRYQLGVWWAEPGYTRAWISPHPADLAWARGRTPTPHGVVEVNWINRPDRFELNVRLPSGVAATVELPVDAEKFTRLQAGPFAFERVEGRWRIELPAGGEGRIAAQTP